MEDKEYSHVLEDLKKRRIPPEIKKVVAVMLDKKAEQVVVLKLKGITDICDFMVICHGNSQRQNQAISQELERRLRTDIKQKPFSIEGQRDANWLLMDYIDFIVHIFSRETRQRFQLEKLWMDAKRYNFYPDQHPSG